MEIQQIAEAVIKLIRERKNGQAKDTFYADHIVSIEGNGDKQRGSMPYTQKNADWGSPDSSDPCCVCFRTTVSR
jgi:hypothetical protein